MTDLCNRCLVIVNATVPVRVKYRDGDMETANPARGPAALKRWVEFHGERSGGDCRFEIGDTTDRFLSVSTWHGDPVCSYHLYLLVDQEQKRGYR